MLSFKKIKDYKVLLLNNKGFEIKHFHLSSLFILFCSFFAMLVILIGIAIYSTDLENIISMNEIRRHNSNNKLLEFSTLTHENKKKMNDFTRFKLI